MRKLIITEFVSLDGVMEAPGGEAGYAHSGWVGRTPGDQHFGYKLRETLEAESLLLGRVTYEGFAGAWPSRDGAFGEKMNAMPKHVVSSTLKNPAWNNTTVIGTDLPTEIGKLKAGEGGPILVAGSRTLAHGLLRAGLVDELRLMIFPVILGSGLRLYADSPDTISLALAETVTFSTGVVLNVYKAA
jgi:dihydrofolate reductase